MHLRTHTPTHPCTHMHMHTHLKSGHGRSKVIELAVGEKSGGMGWPGPYMRCMCAASRGISMMG